MNIIEQAKNAISMPVLPTYDVSTLKSAVYTWCTKRLEAINDCFDAYDLFGSIDDGVDSVTTTNAKLAKAIDTRVVDTAGEIHGFIRVGSDLFIDATESIPVAIVEAGQEAGTSVITFAESEKERLFDYLDIADELSAQQGEVMSYMTSLINSADESGRCASETLTAGLSSQNNTVRDLVTQMLAGGTPTVGQVATVLQNALTNVSSITDADSDDDIGYQFNVDDYVAPVTKDVMTGLWSVLSSSMSAVASIAMICGKGVIGAAGAIGYGITSIVSSLSNKVTEATSVKYGSGASDAYAYAVKAKIDTNAYTTDSSIAAIHTPWGHIMSGAIYYDSTERDHKHPLLIYPSTTRYEDLTPFGPLRAVGFPSGMMIHNPTEYTKLVKYMNDPEVADPLEPNEPDTRNAIMSALIINVSCLAWWFAIRLIGHAVIDRTHPYGYVPPTPEGWMANPDTLLVWGGLNADDVTTDVLDHTAGSYWVANDLEAEMAWLNSILSQPFNAYNVNTGTGPLSFWHIVNACASHILGDSSYANYCTPQRMRDQFFRETVLLAHQGKPFGWAYLEDTPVSLDFIFDPYCVADDKPAIITDPMLVPAEINRKSLLSACGFVLLGAVVTAAAAVVAVVTTKKMLRKKAVVKEQQALDAEEAWKADPTKANLKKMLKAKKRFTRYANWSGYSSNSVGTFNASTSAGLAPARAILDQLNPSQSVVDPSIDSVYRAITGSSLSDN